MTDMFFRSMVKLLGGFLPDEFASRGSQESESASMFPFGLAQRYAQDRIQYDRVGPNVDGYRLQFPQT